MIQSEDITLITDLYNEKLELVDTITLFNITLIMYFINLINNIIYEGTRR